MAQSLRRVQTCSHTKTEATAEEILCQRRDHQMVQVVSLRTVGGFSRRKLTNARPRRPHSASDGKLSLPEEQLRIHSLPAREAAVPSATSGKPSLKDFLLPADLPEVVPTASLEETHAVTDVQSPPRLTFIDENTGATFVDACGTPLGECELGAVYEVEDEQGRRYAPKVPNVTVGRATVKKEADFLWKVRGHKNVAEIFGEGVCLPSKGRLPESPGDSSAAKDLLDRCLKFDVAQHLDATKASRHGLFCAGTCPTVLPEDFRNGPAASVARGIKRSRGDSAQEAELCV
ncbi:hypothetical protein EC991_006865 [Linnemannia zychae]|nr:hypothetical protein EC991_006865 [Linnemannia zychae]